MQYALVLTVVGLGCFVAGVVVTVLFGRRVAKLVTADVTLGIADVKAAVYGTEMRVKNVVRSVEAGVHDKLNGWKNALAEDVKKL